VFQAASEPGSTQPAISVEGLTAGVDLSYYEPGFDPDRVEVYGLGLSESGGAVGQTQWSMYAASNGWEFLDQNPWGQQYRYDDPRLHEALTWWRGLIEKGYMPTLEIATSGVEVFDTFGAGGSAMNTNGSWLSSVYFGYEGVEVGMAPTPIGPSGQRASMFNGLADSIWAGSSHQDQAWEWVRYLASVECQTTIGEAGVVLPAIPEALAVAETAFADQGVALDAFTVHIDEGTTFLYPVTDHFADVSALVEPAMDSFLLFEAEAAGLADVNDQVNALFE
jgi:multiple sugar transport system substrate-binding protein